MIKLSSTTSTNVGQKARSAGNVSAAYLGAAALSVVGGLASSPLTQAAPPMPLSPPCSEWHLNGNMPISQTNGQRIDVPWQGSQVGGGSGLATSFQGNEKQFVGTPQGGASGSNIDFTIGWTNNVTGHYTASINNDGAVVLGVSTDSQNHRTDWHTDAKFTCAVTAAAPPVAPPPAGPPPVDTHVAPPVTNAITLTFSPPGFGNVTATVANSSDLTGKCHYHADPSNTNRDFTVNPHNSTDLTFTGLNTGTTYHATVTCSDASGKQQQPIGTSSASVKF